MARATLSQWAVEVLGDFVVDAHVSQYVIEALVPTDTFSPTTVTGAGVSQELIEVLGTFPGKVRLTQSLIEVLITEADVPQHGGTIVSREVRVFGYAG